LAAKLAAVRSSTKTEAVLTALENELARIEGERSLAERLTPLQERSRPFRARAWRLTWTFTTISAATRDCCRRFGNRGQRVAALNEQLAKVLVSV
jgi:hypothetical protein